MASKSKRRGRVFRASCILAALIIAGSSFAWFTTKDEVTNRLSANADYDVSIVESFAPPKNFLPGQEVNKDVYAVNTGTIAAFVRETITSKMTLTQEKRVEAVRAQNGGESADDYKAAVAAYIDENELIKLTPAEVYSVEAGSYLAFRPDTSTDAKKATLGKQVVAFDINDFAKLDSYEGTNAVIKDTNNNVIGITTDFAPDENGLYVFRRTIKINDAGKTGTAKENDLRYATEDFTYEAYYYFDGDFYKVRLTSVTGDSVIDLANDGKDTDGILTAAEYNFFKEETKTVTPKLYYDAKNHRLVAKVDGFKAGTYPGTLGETYDAAVDAYEDALIQLYDAVEKYEAMDAKEKGLYLDYIQKLIATNKAEQKYVNELNNYNNLKTATTSALNELKNKIDNTGSPASTGDSLKKAAEDLYGVKYDTYRPKGIQAVALDSDTATAPVNYNGAAEVFGSGITDPATDTTNLPQGWKTADTAGWSTWYTKVSACVKTGDTDSKLKAYVDAKRAYELSIHDEDDRVAADNAFLAELQAYWNAKKADNGWSSDDMSSVTTIEDYAEYLFGKTKAGNYATNYIDEFVGWVTTNATTQEEHDQYAKRAALLKAETEYNDAVALYKTMTEQVKALQTAYSGTDGNGGVKGLRDKSKTDLYGTQTNIESGQSNEPMTTNQIDAFTTDNMSDLNTECNDWDTKGGYYEAYVDAKKDELTAKKAYEDAKGKDTDTGDTTTLGAKKAKEEAEKAVADAKATMDKARMAYEQGTDDYNKTGDIIIYVNLNKDAVTTVGGTKDQWQLVPVKTLTDELTDDTAVFYYTGILQGGETSAKLIDSVELDKDVTQYMYKSFDFDLDVKMDSAQIAYGSDDITLQATPANEEFGNVTTNVKGANVALADPTDIETALTWTSKT